jgi:photosystem II stability/assembly factor-like uncharacterized protein
MEEPKESQPSQEEPESTQLNQQAEKTPEQSFIKRYWWVGIIIVAVGVGVVGILVNTVFKEKNPNSLYGSVHSSNPDVLKNGAPIPCTPQNSEQNYRTQDTLAVDPTNANTVYVNVEYKGFYKSTNGGKTWIQKDKGIPSYATTSSHNRPCYTEFDMTRIDPTNPSRILLGASASPGTLKDPLSLNGGLFESTDGGNHWHQLVHDTMQSFVTRALVMDPANTNTIYYGTSNLPPDNGDPAKRFVTKGVVYKTTDNGKNWTELSTGLIDNLRSVNMFIDAKNPQNLYVATLANASQSVHDPAGNKPSANQLGMLKTTNGGTSWTKMTGLPANGQAVAMAAVSDTNFNHIYVTSIADQMHPTAYYSTDGTSFVAGQYLDVASYDPNDVTGMRMLGYDRNNSQQGVQESLDGGMSWHAYGQRPAELNNPQKYNASNIVWSTKTPAVVYMSGNNGYVWKSTDNGKTWALILSADKLK